MSFETSDDDGEAMSDINMTPLVDVMLVLVIIFIITIPVINHSIKIDLPRASNQPNDPKPKNIDVTIDAHGQAFWNNAPVDEAALQTRLASAAAQQPQPELHLRADREVRYEYVAKVMAAAQRNGVSKIGFITDPERSK